MASGPEIMQMLMQRGLSPEQAAILAGHMQQESGFNPKAFNQREGAEGLIQHRLDRRDALHNYASSRGTPVADPGTQIDFILNEMRGSEAKRGGADFLAGGDLPTLHAALKRYIRYGDNSDATRLANARSLLGQPAAAPTAAPGVAAPFALAGAGAPAEPQQPGAVPQVALQALRQNLQDDQQEPLEPVQINMAKPIGLAAVRRLLASMKGDA